MASRDIGKWVLHVGYQKTGSTWLQKCVFPLLSQVEFIGKRYTGQAPWVGDLKCQLCFGRDLDFSPDKVRELIAGNMSGVDERKVRVCSVENFVGEWRFGSQDAKRSADRLREVFGAAKILMVIRNQVEIIESFYKQYLRWGGIVTFDAFLQAGWRSHIDFRLEHVNYLNLVKYYHKLFGSENVRVMMFENLAANPQRFADDVCDFIGADKLTLPQAKKERENEGFSPNVCYYRRLTNYLTVSHFNPSGFVEPLKQGRSKLPAWLHPEGMAARLAGLEEWLGRQRELISSSRKQEMGDHFRPSNRELQQLIGEDLEAAGYPV